MQLSLDLYIPSFVHVYAYRASYVAVGDEEEDRLATRFQMQALWYVLASLRQLSVEQLPPALHLTWSTRTGMLHLKIRVYKIESARKTNRSVHAWYLCLFTSRWLVLITSLATEQSRARVVELLVRSSRSLLGP